MHKQKVQTSPYVFGLILLLVRVNFGEEVLAFGIQIWILAVKEDENPSDCGRSGVRLGSCSATRASPIQRDLLHQVGVGGVVAVDAAAVVVRSAQRLHLGRRLLVTWHLRSWNREQELG